MSKRSSRGTGEAVPKLHSLKHPDVSDDVLVLCDFAEECRKITEQGDGPDPEADPLYSCTKVLREPTPEDMDVTTEKFKELKELMNPRVFWEDAGIPSTDAPSFSLLRDKQLYLKESSATSGNSLFKPMTMNSFEGSDKEKERLPPHELVISLSFYNKKKKRKDFEYVVLGSNRLTRLKDVLLCPNNFLPLNNCSHLSLEEAKKTVKRRTDQPSGYFFINDTFYNDMRRPGSIDYSVPIRSWAKKKNLKSCARLDTFKTADMHNTRFVDLKLRLGFPYLFCHCGECEHLIIFNQIRMLHSTDPQYAEDYPRLVYSCKRQTKECVVCKRSKAVWITANDPLALEDPCLFCDSCYIMLHQDVQGRQLYEHEAYPFVAFVTPDMLLSSDAEEEEDP